MKTKYDNIEIKNREKTILFSTETQSFYSLFRITFTRNGSSELEYFEKQFPEETVFNYMSIVTILELKTLSENNMLNSFVKSVKPNKTRYAIAYTDDNKVYSFSYSFETSKAIKIAEDITLQRFTSFQETDLTNLKTNELITLLNY